MHVDGGRQLTSRGHVDWYGTLLMNRLFEQDSLAELAKQLNSVFKAQTEERKPSAGEDLYDWVETA